MGVWQSLTGDVNWGFSQRFSDFKKSMTFTPPKHELRQEIPAAQYDPADFGSSSSIASLSVSYPNTPQNFSKYAQLSANELGTQTVKSFNGGSLLGVQYNSATINANDGTRSTSRKFYDEASKRSNFQIFYQMMAKKILLVKNAKGNPQATGVAYSTLPGGLGTTGILYARKEVIVSGGAFHSPQLLMVSGIGPQAQLQAQSIPVVVQNENVGQGMVSVVVCLFALSQFIFVVPYHSKITFSSDLPTRSTLISTPSPTLLLVSGLQSLLPQGSEAEIF